MKQTVIITERTLFKTEEIKYKKKGYKVFNVFNTTKPYIFTDTKVGMLLDTLYTPTILYLEKLLYFKHTVVAKYKDETYKINESNWKSHPIRCQYLTQQEAYKEQQKVNKYKERLCLLQEQIDIDIDITQLDNYLKTFAKLYDIEYEQDPISKLLAYNQIKYYLDNNLDYFNPPVNIDPEEESNLATQNWNGIEVVSFGDAQYFEDYVYQRGC